MDKLQPRHIESSSGFALVSVLLVMTFLLTVVGGLLVFGRVSVRYAKFQEQRAQAFYVAESGINDALNYIESQETPVTPADSLDDADTLPVTSPLQSGSYTVWYYKSGDEKHLRSEGLVGDIKRTVDIAVGGGSLFPQDIVEVGDGPYVATPAFPEPSEIPSGQHIPGFTVNSTRDVEEHSAIYIEDSVTLKNNAVWNINGPGKKTIVIDGDLTMNNGSTINIAHETYLELWIKGSLENKESGYINTDTSVDDPVETFPRFYIQGSLRMKHLSIGGWLDARPLIFFLDTSTEAHGTVDVDLYSMTNLYGAIYAPTRDVTLYSGAQVTGSVVGHSVTLQGSATVDYISRDDLVTLPNMDTTVTFTTGTWQEIR